MTNLTIVTVYTERSPKRRSRYFCVYTNTEFRVLPENINARPDEREPLHECFMFGGTGTYWLYGKIQSHCVIARPLKGNCFQNKKYDFYEILVMYPTGPHASDDSALPPPTPGFF